MRCASLAAAAAVVVVNIFPDDDDDDDDLTPKQPPRSSHKEEEEDKEIVRKQAVFKEEDKETEDLLPKREAASFREMNICVFCARAWCSLVFVWVFPRGKFSSEVLKNTYLRERERESLASSSSASPESSLFTTSGRGRVCLRFLSRARGAHLREREVIL